MNGLSWIMHYILTTMTTNMIFCRQYYIPDSQVVTLSKVTQTLFAFWTIHNLVNLHSNSNVISELYYFRRIRTRFIFVSIYMYSITSNAL